MAAPLSATAIPPTSPSSSVDNTTGGNGDAYVSTSSSSYPEPPHDVTPTYGALIYPDDLPDKYYLSITFSEYVRPDPFISLVQFTEISDRPSTIHLPLPANLEDSLSLGWGSVKMGPGVEMAGDAASGKLSEAVAAGVDFGIENGASVGIGLAGHALAGLVSAKSQITSNMINDATNDASAQGKNFTTNLLQRGGKSLNPVLTMQFSNPDFKTHVFKWKFSPESATESTTLANIINAIEYQSKPSGKNGGVFFGYPSIATVKIVTGTNFLYNIQQCVVTNYRVNYTPLGIPSFFAGTSAPVSVELEIHLTEIILNTRENSRINTDGFSTPLNLGLSGANQLDDTIAGIKNILGGLGL
jgi:hypothetical protein